MNWAESFAIVGTVWGIAVMVLSHLNFKYEENALALEDKKETNRAARAAAEYGLSK